MESLHRSASIEIECVSQQILYCNWLGTQSYQSIVDSGAIILKLIQENHFTKVLNDNTKVTDHWYSGAQWTTQQWFPAIVAAGVQRFAWIVSPNVFARLSAERAASKVKVVKIFKDYNEAYTWLSQS